ncbi:GtrA family protein [Alloscardovia theropitheci]|uniref:GtrA family protein n=1 Tax=Alloscardovia theropitheci TaxID=2496842 RepID=A0A4R0QZP3_9BIFI|nr:GtrA family protein [Alloscardovia theropitheci]TCD54146.1 GtrA family protein [Alloscardovia theropitheci]
MKNLITQIAKFGVVGIIAAVLDFGILNILVALFHMNATLAGTISFILSLIFNYAASMKYVFVHRPDMARWMEIVIFIVSANIGLFINVLILWVSTDVLLPAGVQPGDTLYTIYTNGGKIVATVVVAVWNFVIRKWLLDAPEDGQIDPNSIAHKIGEWSLKFGK